MNIAEDKTQMSILHKSSYSGNFCIRNMGYTELKKRLIKINITQEEI
jgi:hypothetical protein